MLIVCPNCATSYMIDPTSVGSAGRAVRCARCRSTWFVGPGKPTGAPNVSAFVSGVIAEAEAQQNGQKPQAAPEAPPPPAAFEHLPRASEFPREPADVPPNQSPDVAPSDFDDARHDNPAYDVDSHRSPDGEPVTITDAPSLVPPIDHEPLHGAYPDRSDDGEEESFLARRQRMKAKRTRSRRTSRWTAVILVLFALNVAVIGARHEVVRYLPQTASLFATVGLPVNLRNLQFDKVRITREVTDGVNMLIVDGTVMNTANKPTDVPRLRFAARNAAGQEVYTWTAQPSRSILGPLESMTFSSRLAAPPAEATDVLVRFFNAQDVAGGK